MKTKVTYILSNINKAFAFEWILKNINKRMSKKSPKCHSEPVEESLSA